MSQRLRIEPLAEDDVTRAYRWYEGQQAGLGEDLLTALDECFTRVTENPSGYQVIYKGVRRALVRRFPYCVYFITTKTEVIILAVLHGHRTPQPWRKRT